MLPVTDSKSVLVTMTIKYYQIRCLRIELLLMVYNVRKKSRPEKHKKNSDT